MKYIILGLSILVLGISPSVALASTPTIAADGTNITGDDDDVDAHNYRIYSWDEDGTFSFASDSTFKNPGDLPWVESQTAYVATGNYYLMFTYNANDSYCNGQTYTDCLAGVTDPYATCQVGVDEVCSGEPGPPPETATSTAIFSTTTQQIDNESQNIFNGILLFFIGMFLAIWIHKQN